MPARVSIVMVLLIAGFAATATAEPAPPSAADLAFLDSLANFDGTVPDVGTPAPKAMGPCNVTNDCGSDPPVSCNGNNTCQTTFAGVKCDGVETRCPNFCTIGQTCQCCNGPYNSFCWSKDGDCQYTAGGISCNGHEFTCETGCPLCPDW